MGDDDNAAGRHLGSGGADGSSGTAPKGRTVYNQVDFPAGRYGRRRTPKRTARWVVPILVVGVMAAGFTMAWRMYQTYAGDTIQSQVTAFHVVSDSVVRIEFQVVKDAGQPAVCIVRARSADGDEVGRAEAPVPAGRQDERSIVSTYMLATSKKAVTGEVHGCAPVID